MTTSLPSGLRERKKARTRAAIREHAMRLFEEQGYAATTVDQIAEAAEVSQSTFFRYFPTKEDVVLVDDWDPLIVAAVKAQPPEVSPITAIRNGIHEVVDNLSEEDWEREKRRQRMFRETPELMTRAMFQYTETIRLLGAAVAERAGLPPTDFAARVLAGAVIGATMAAIPGGGTGVVELADFEGLDRAFELLEAGLPLH
ncbi:TetR family transcriptional regulator [Actinoplanes sp. NPDC051633]|uniref:acyl-CoA-like ligand-binding transcription factor n=1 Tax=Actinoplanes sp. NPDC051633 TaxID=3155670 RepID=UPI00343AB8B4